jgi:hypothetical protein
VHCALILQNARFCPDAQFPTSPADKVALSIYILGQELSAGETADLAFAAFQANIFDELSTSIGLLHNRQSDE